MHGIEINMMMMMTICGAGCCRSTTEPPTRGQTICTLLQLSLDGTDSGRTDTKDGHSTVLRRWPHTSNTILRQWSGFDTETGDETLHKARHETATSATSACNSSRATRSKTVSCGTAVNATTSTTTDVSAVPRD